MSINLTNESKEFHYSVYTIVCQIPEGKVTSYGHIAYLINRPKNSRMVGSALKHCGLIINSLRAEHPQGQIPFTYESLPWWRVISSAGKISPRESNGEFDQAQRLKEEGVAVLAGYKVDLEEFGWFPDVIEST
jgi:methylated-DNA-protein-cysteine methyltransferase-like protein